MWIVSLVFLFSSLAFADCTSPAGKEGELRYISSDFKYCNNTSWVSTTVVVSGTSCTNSGEISRDGSDLRFCNGANWVSSSGSTTATCPAGFIGMMVWNGVSKTYEWCDGTNYRTMGNSSVTPPPAGAPTNLMMLFAGNSGFGNFMWSPGSGNGGPGGCKIQYLKDGTTWTDTLDNNIFGLPPLDCDAESGGMVLFSLADNWTNNFATGVSFRLVRTSTEEVLGVFPELAVCSPSDGSSSSTPFQDEDCDGRWDNIVNAGGTPGCGGGQICLTFNMHPGLACAPPGFPFLYSNACLPSEYAAMVNSCSPNEEDNTSMMIVTASECFQGGTNTYY